MATESSLSKAEKDSLIIERFIFHIIIKGKEEPEYLNEVELGDSETDFFRERIVDSCNGTQYVFIDDNGAKPELQQWVIKVCDDELDFVEISQSITKHFFIHHKGNVNDGVFIVAIVSIMKNGNKCKMLSLIKMDHTRVLQFETTNTEEGRKAILKEIVNTFVEDKNAVQKVALVDTSSTFLWDVLSKERNRSEGIADYFKLFLGVEVRETNSFWTRKAVGRVKQWAANIFNFPTNENVATYKFRAINYMENHDNFDTNLFVETVVKDTEDNQRKIEMKNSLLNSLAEIGIAEEHKFIPMPDSLVKAKKFKVKTNRNVKIQWEGSPENRGISIPNEKSEDNKYHIVILTDTKPEVE